MKGKGKELRIRNFPDELLRTLRVEAAQRGVSLRELVIGRLGQKDSSPFPPYYSDFPPPHLRKQREALKKKEG